jgi:hypothetical protein
VSDALWVLLRPAAAYPQLAKFEIGSAWKRPLAFAFLCGCIVSLAASGRLTLRLVAPAMLYAALIPALEIPVLAAILRRGRSVSLRRAVDLFFMGHAAWCLWLFLLAAVFAFADPIRAFQWTAPLWYRSTAAFMVIWSAYTDYCFFRCVSPGRAGWNLLALRTVCWSVGLAIFGGASLWAGLLGVLGK